MTSRVDIMTISCNYDHKSHIYDIKSQNYHLLNWNYEITVTVIIAKMLKLWQVWLFISLVLVLTFQVQIST